MNMYDCISNVMLCYRSRAVDDRSYYAPENDEYDFIIYKDTTGKLEIILTIFFLFASI